MTDMRIAMAQDVAAVAELRRQFWLTQFSSGLRDGRTLDVSMLEAETAKLIVRPRSALMVLESSHGSNLVGYAFATQLAAPNLSPPFVRSLEEIFVQREFGGQGVGRRLAEAVLGRVGISDARCQIRVIWGNEAGRAFWRQLGFEPSVVIMERGPHS